MLAARLLLCLLSNKKGCGGADMEIPFVSFLFVVDYFIELAFFSFLASTSTAQQRDDTNTTLHSSSRGASSRCPARLSTANPCMFCILHVPVVEQHPPALRRHKVVRGRRQSSPVSKLLPFVCHANCTLRCFSSFQVD